MDIPSSIISLAGGSLRRNMYAVVGSRTAHTDAWAMALIPASLTSSRWLTARAPSSPPNYDHRKQGKALFLLSTSI